MMCKAQEAGLRAQKAWEQWIESELSGTSRFYSEMRRAKLNRRALAADDCIPRKVGEQAQEALDSALMTEGMTALMKIECEGPCQFLNPDDPGFCTWHLVSKALAVLDKALKGDEQ